MTADYPDDRAEGPSAAVNGDGPMRDLDAAEVGAEVDRVMGLIRDMALDLALGELSELEPALRFSKDTALRVQWARCLNGLGFIELMDAKQERPAEPVLDAAAQAAFHRDLHRALAHFEQALAIQGDPAYRIYPLGNKAYALALLGRLAEARPVLQRLFADEGRPFVDGQLEDTRRRTVPEDAAVVRQINEVWSEISGQ